MFTSRRSGLTATSGRSMVLGRGGMACTSQPLASFAAAELLRGGANAVDAAVCAAAVLGVVEPFSTGFGGDCFMLIWSAKEQRLFGLNGSGRAPRAATLTAVQERGLREMPSHGMLAVTIPGAVDAWSVALDRFGSRGLGQVLEPAIQYARHGFPVSEIIVHQWALCLGFLQNEAARRTFTIDGRAPVLGEVVRLPGLARSLEAIGAGGRDVFYRGELAEQIVACSRQHDGWHTAEDLAAHESTWVEPIATSYRGYDVHEIPPNGQGLAALIALNILECFDLRPALSQAATAHHLRIEAVKLAFADRNRYIADPQMSDVPTAQLLSKDYAQGRAALISPSKALKNVAPGSIPVGNDTVYLTTADAEGNVVSLITCLRDDLGSSSQVVCR
jgi:gamma-glutamyltranspeptidase/glutathione hydrolase